MDVRINQRELDELRSLIAEQKALQARLAQIPLRIERLVGRIEIQCGVPEDTPCQMDINAGTVTLPEPSPKTEPPSGEEKPQGAQG